MRQSCRWRQMRAVDSQQLQRQPHQYMVHRFVSSALQLFCMLLRFQHSSLIILVNICVTLMQVSSCCRITCLILVLAVCWSSLVQDKNTFLTLQFWMMLHVLLHAVSSHLGSIIAIPCTLACLLQTLRSFSEYRTHQHELFSSLDVVITSHLHWYSFIGYLIVTVLHSKQQLSPSTC